MMNEIMKKLRKLETIENMFGEELIDAIVYGECADTYVVKVYDYPYVTLSKEKSLEENYFTLIEYLTWMKNKYMNDLQMSVDEEELDANDYCMDWCVFKANYNIRKAWFYLHIKDIENPEEITELLADIQGKNNYHAIVSLLSTKKEDVHRHAYNVMEYVGKSRAIRDLCHKYLDVKMGATQWQFHLWHNMPYTLVEVYGHVFYIGNEMSSLEYCPYDYEPKEYYYDALYTKLNTN